jgi:hypothetical protein
VNENCNQSSSTAKNALLLENLNCLKANENSDGKDLYPPLATLKNRIATMFQRFSMATSTASKENSSCEHHNPTLMRRNNTFELFSNYFGYRTSRTVNFTNVRNELLTLRRFRCCDEENNQESKKETLDK